MASKGLRVISYQGTQNIEASYKTSHTSEILIGYLLGLVFILSCYPFKLECPSKEPTPGPSIKM